MTDVTTYYPGDAILLDGLSKDQRSDFIKYMSELDDEHKKRGSPYGESTLWKATGAQCWWSFFDDGYTAADAIEEDLSADD